MKFTQVFGVAITAASIVEGHSVRRAKDKNNKQTQHLHEKINAAVSLPPVAAPLPLVQITVGSVQLQVNTSAPLGDAVAAQALAQKKISMSSASSLSPSTKKTTSTSSTKGVTTSSKGSTSSTKVSTSSTKGSTSSTKGSTSSTKGSTSSTKGSTSSTKGSTSSTKSPTSSSTKQTSSTLGTSTKSSSTSASVSSSGSSSASPASSSASSTASSTASSSASSSGSSSASSAAASSSSSVSSTASSSDSSSASSAAASSSSSSVSSTASSSDSSSSFSSSTSSAAASSSSSLTSSSASSAAASSSSSSSSSALPSASAIANSVSSTILVIARDAPSALEATTGLNAYGIPYETFTVPQAGAELPVLNSSSTSGNYGGIILLGEVSYDYGGGAYHSALNDTQYATLYTYQTEFGVRLVRIDVYPGSTTGTSVAGSCCTDPQDQTVYFSDVSAFPSAGLIVGATHSTAGLFHYVAAITDSTIATPFLKYGASGSYADGGIGGVINNIAGRQQMVFFITFGIAFSPTSNYIQHSFIHWVTRGAYVGFRRVNLNTQIDDMFLTSDIYVPTLPAPGTTSPIPTTYRLTTADLDITKSWTATINSKLTAKNPGSSYFVEIGHNGDGNIITADDADEDHNPPYCGIGAIYLDQGDDVGGLEFQKPLGTGDSLWPTTPTDYPYTTKCLNLDTMKTWFATPANRDVFAHISHTFTHEAENNATYFDITREIKWNQAWLTQSGIAAATKFSPHGIIPPAITGLHNGDAIQAWVDNGITNVVGDNSRPLLRNTQNVMYALTTNVAGNGYAGLNVIPRWPTNIYYNCDTQNCTHTEWVVFSKGYGTFDDLLTYEKTVTSRYLYGLYHDAYMFHQANLRVNDIPYLTTINGVSTKLSIFQAWVETVVQEMIRTVTWPIITIKHDDMGAKFIEREKRDACVPKMSYLINTATQKITGVTVSANGNTCSVQIPVTLPGPVVSQQGATAEQVGNDPLTLWTTLSGSPVTYTLTTPVSF